MNNKRKIAFFGLVLIICGVFLFKNPIVAVAFDFNKNNDTYGVYDTDLKMLKRGETYCFDDAMMLVLEYRRGENDIFLDEVDYISDYCFKFNPPGAAGNYDNWFIDGVSYDSSRTIISVRPYVYDEPSFSLSCNPTILSQGEVSDCLLKIKYYSKIDSLIFDINVKDYEIISAREGNDFENLIVNENRYSLVGKETMNDFGTVQETNVLSFKIKALKNIDINSNDNITIENINYKDKIKEGTKDNLSATVKQNKVNNTDISNPVTSNSFIYILFVLITTIILVSTNKRYKKIIKRVK